MKNAVNFIGFQAAWFACVLGAARGQAWLGVLAVAAAVAVHLAWTRRTTAVGEAKLLAIVGAAGCLVEAANVALGVYAPAAGLGLGAPLFYVWMAAFWINFGSTLNASMAWMRGRPALAAVFGAIGGPLAFLGGEKLGGLTLSENQLLAYGALAVLWAVATPLVVWLAERLGGSGEVADSSAGR